MKVYVVKETTFWKNGGKTTLTVGIYKYKADALRIKRMLKETNKTIELENFKEFAIYKVNEFEVIE